MSHRPLTHVGINAHLLAGSAGYRQAGIHHYMTQLLCHLPEQAGWRYSAFVGPQASTLLNNAPVSSIQSRWPTERRLARIAWEQMAWPLLNQRHEVDLVHSLAFVTPFLSRRPSVVTIYDLSFIRFPDRFPTMQRLYLNLVTRVACQRAKRIVAISASGKRDIVAQFGVPAGQIDVVYPGVDPHFKPASAKTIAQFRATHGLPEKFLLHVGTLQPRKNIPTLLEALAKINRPDLPLYLVGGKGWLYDEIYARIEQLGLTQQVIFPGYVPDADLPLWYNAASLLLFPSVYEGFGMPVIQALACGTPVIASNSSAIPEAAGDAAPLFDPEDSDALASRMVDVLDHSEVADTIRARGLQHAQRFTWPEAGVAMAESYRQAVSN